MITSMTGYGQGEASKDGATVTVEVRTVNHRFLDFSVKVPRMLHPRERDIKEAAKAKLARGRIYITVTVDTEAPDRAATINEDVMADYLGQLVAFSKKHNIDGNVSVDTLVQLPDVIVTEEHEQDAETLWPLVEKSLGRALDSCSAMRNEEGAALKKDLSDRIKGMKLSVDEVEKAAPDVSRKHAETFRKRIDQLRGDVHVDEERLITEIAIMSDRLDFTEEITRLRSHEAQFNKALDEGGEVSKRLTYLLQEIHRECSTIGSKASDSEVIQHVVSLKEETEKLREQVQNIE